MVNTTVGGNEAPVFSPHSYIFTFSENAINAQVIGILSVSDDDGNKEAIYYYLQCKVSFLSTLDAHTYVNV